MNLNPDLTRIFDPALKRMFRTISICDVFDEPIPPMNEDGYIIKGSCGICGNEVTDEHPRTKNGDGTYIHLECLDVEIRGTCPRCGENVTNKCDRTVDDEGVYWHTICKAIDNHLKMERKCSDF